MEEHEHQHIPLKGSSCGIQYAGWKPAAGWSGGTERHDGGSASPAPQA
jgi:hypothetical protein